MSTLSGYTSLQQRLKSIPLLIQGTLLIAATAMPIFMPGTANAAQLTSRKITIGGTGSQASANATLPGQTGVTYQVDFTVATTGNIRGVVVDFCSDSPVIGITCTAPTGFSLTPATLGTTTGITGFTKDGSSTASKLVLTNAAGGSVTASSPVAITVNSVTNPTQACNASAANICTFYARILTFATDTAATSYTSTTPGSYVDNGGVAISTANQLTITARVQEVLHFCVGTLDAGTNSDCRDLSGTSIDLGVLDPSQINTDSSGRAMIRTNAASGASISYYAEKNNSSGSLKVAGATCSGISLTDQCINSAGTTATAISNGNELFGMRTSLDTTNGTTANLTRDTPYAQATDIAWDDTNTDLIASSTTVLDDEMLNLTFAATAGTTTPTGQYTVTTTFIATGTF